MESSKRVQVTAAVITEEGRVLLAQRPLRGRHPGAWEFPGGKVEAAETPRQCLARELREELGIEVEAGEEVARVSHSYPDLDIELVAFRCTITGGELEDLGCEAHAWVAPGALPGYDLLPPDREIAERGLLPPAG